LRYTTLFQYKQNVDKLTRIKAFCMTFFTLKDKIIILLPAKLNKKNKQLFYFYKLSFKSAYLK